jgi:hypothetical protein
MRVAGDGTRHSGVAARRPPLFSWSMKVAVAGCIAGSAGTQAVFPCDGGAVVMEWNRADSRIERHQHCVQTIGSSL